MSDDTQPPGAPEVPGAPEDGAGAPRTSLEKTPSPAAPAPDERDPWAPPAPDGPGHTVAANEPPAWAGPTVHDQRTMAALPTPGTPGQPGTTPWAHPAAPGPAADPFAPPADPGPYAASYGEPVPPPPIGPEGPGQVPYGYPGTTGHPGTHGYPGGAHASGGYSYGWPGMHHPLPSNGMGTAGLVLGIISAVIFCLWPIAIILGVLALIFGAIGRGKARRGEATNPGQALAGIICGVAGIVLGVGMLVLVVFVNL
ncbi:DUF4190 domain-containing protein [Streptomyces sp. SS1-1]|uniref:DUF4190 domain-containing protein n=1 Tax=Streptomyces sp. SS1-1 TaxID=2651869 RepID=UPI001CEF7117|nr:DUF4190 domain-containing protein [Streptomyces sp. SS1-1]